MESYMIECTLESSSLPPKFVNTMPILDSVYVLEVLANENNTQQLFYSNNAYNGNYYY